MGKTCHEHYCALWLKVHYIMKKTCNIVVFHHHCYPLEVNFIVHFFFSLDGARRWHIPCLGDHFLHFYIVSFRLYANCET